MSRNPEEIVKDLAPAYKEWKGGEKSKNKFKEEFFDAITEYLEEHGEPAESYLMVTAPSEEAAIESAMQQRPGWIVDAVRPCDDIQDAWEVIVVEDPQYMSFTVEFDGQVWGRQVAEGSMMLDDDRIQAEDPDLWKAVTSYPHQLLLEDIAYEAGMSPKDEEFEMDEYKGFGGYIEWQCERHGVHRSLKPMDEIDDADLAGLKKYMYPGPPQIKLPAPKKVKQ